MKTAEGETPCTAVGRALRFPSPGGMRTPKKTTSYQITDLFLEHLGLGAEAVASRPTTRCSPGAPEACQCVWAHFLWTGKYCTESCPLGPRWMSRLLSLPNFVSGASVRCHLMPVGPGPSPAHPRLCIMPTFLQVIARMLQAFHAGRDLSTACVSTSCITSL